MRQPDPPGAFNSPSSMILLCGIALLVLLPSCRREPSSGDGPGAPAARDFATWMNVGKNYYDKGEAQRAIEPFLKAVELKATAPEAQLNLANAYLLAGQPTNALTHAERAVALDPDLAAAHYVAGCAQMRLRQFEAALGNFQLSKDREPAVGATTFQLGRAHQELGHWEEAIATFQELLGFEPEHPTAWYTLSQSLIRAGGRQDEANAALEKHGALIAARGPGTMDVTRLERCVHTEARAPFILEQPDRQGITVKFADVTAAVLPDAARYDGPLAFIDYNRDGRNSLFVREGDGFRLLINSNGLFAPHPLPLPGQPGATYHRCLVADLQNDRFDDVLVVGDQGTRVFRFATNAQISDASAFSRLGNVGAIEGVLVDLDFTGKLDLLAVDSSNRTVQVLRNLGNIYFKDITATSGVPATLTGATQIAFEDWNNDEQLDALIARGDQPPALLVKARGGPLVPTNAPPQWPPGSVIALGDFNNDLRGDLVIAAPNSVEIHFNGMTSPRTFPVSAADVTRLFPFDYDNDGWLDLWVAGKGLRVFRNLGDEGFTETTAALDLTTLAPLTITGIAAADIENDGDSDVVFQAAGQGLKVLRNNGGNANLQIKVRLLGNRSNASGFGTRVEVRAGGLRVGRRVDHLPVEIGVARHAQLESLNAHWLNLSLNNVDVQVDARTTLPLWELNLPEGSCPYLYTWDGSQFRFVTDLLGAAPLGLRISESRFVDADPDELVWLGGPDTLRPRDGSYELRITEELREVLYLDAAELVVVDHPPDTEVFSTGKMVPGRPFPQHEIIALRNPRAPARALRSDGLDVTEALRHVDRHMVSPVELRIPQLRGLAEPWSVTLDFGSLPDNQSLILGITGWLRFGGGMANVAASHHPDLPFPFPTLEAETAPDQWRDVDLVFGAPCGKTKSFIVDLTGKLPPNTRRLRISTAYEIHWDRIALLDQAPAGATRITRLISDTARLRYRGFSSFEDLPWTQPLTPDYNRVSPNPSWRITPAGWCTRYGDVQELIERRDNALALLNGGDELQLRFAEGRVPPLPDAMSRSFFLYSSGWDKDSDFHCEKGMLVGPLPWHGMDDQAYGREPRPPFEGDGWIAKYNTRWVGPYVGRRPEPDKRP